MKKFCSMICLAMFLFLSLANAYAANSKDKNIAQEDPVAFAPKEKKPLMDTEEASTVYGKTPFNKLTRGVMNIATFYLEIPASAIRVTREKDNALLGATVGTAQGLFVCLFRALTAAYDTATFLIPSYKKPVLEPEYAIQSLEEASE